MAVLVSAAKGKPQRSRRTRRNTEKRDNRGHREHAEGQAVAEWVLGEGWRCAPKGRWRKGRPGRQECRPQARKPAPQGGLPHKSRPQARMPAPHRNAGATKGLERESEAIHQHKAAGVASLAACSTRFAGVASKAACSTEGAADGVWKDRAVGMCVALPARPPAWQAWRLAPQDFPVWHARLRAPRRGRCGWPGGMLHLGAGYSREAAVRMASATEAAARM